MLSRLRKSYVRKLSSMYSSFSNIGTLPPPTLNWTGDEGGYEIEIMDRTDVIKSIPSNAKAALARRRRTVWKAVVAGASKVWSFVGESKLPGLERAIYEVPGSLSGGEEDKMSLFGSAVTRALAGDAATDPRLPYISARSLARTIQSHMEKDLEALNARNRAQNPLCPLIAQVPVTAGKAMAQTFVCSLPSPPCPPLPPYSVKLTDTAVHLKWLSMPFSGEDALEYNLQARGQAKLNRAWTSVGTYAKISAMWFNVVHLVPGVALQFRVRAANHGGWGGWSDASEFYRPYANPVMAIGENMQAAIAIGAREVLSSMKKYFTAMEAQTLGSKVLVTVATRDGGFKRGSVAKECVSVALSGMTRFPLDSLVQSYGCLLLGWACFARPQIAKEAREQVSPFGGASASATKS